MSDALTRLLGPNDEDWNTSQSDAKRQAIAALRGYAYQLHQSLAAWIALPDGATLHLEISEDFAQIAHNPSTLEDVLIATQVKDTRESGSVTLNSADALDAIRNYWALRVANPGRKVRFVFLTTSPIGQERKDPLSTGEKALEAWGKVGRGGKAEALRSALLKRFPLEVGEELNGEGLALFLTQSDDAALRSELISPIRWACGAQDMAGVAADNRDALVTLGQSLGGTPDLSVRAADILLAQILSTIIDSSDRRLRRGQLIEALYTAITVRLPAQQAFRATSLQARGLDLDATGSWRIATVLDGRFAPRERTVSELRRILSENDVIWVHGATGLGKSLLAELVAQDIGGEWRILDLRNAVGATARERLVAARLALLADPNVSGVIIDDLLPSLERDVETPLMELSQSLDRRQLPLFVTSNNPPSQRLARALNLGDIASYSTPGFERDDAAALVAAYGGDPARWASFAWLVGGGHPQLIDVVIAGLERRGWPDSAMRDWMAAGWRNEDVEAEQEAARRRLLSELAPEALGLLARTARIYGIFDRRLVHAVGAVAPALSAPGLLLDQLAGQWIERVGSVGLRLSPLVSGLERETLNKEQLKLIDLAILTHIFTRNPVDASLFDTGFCHAWLAKDEGWINFLIQQVIELDDKDRPKLASAVPLMREANGDLGFLGCRPYVVLLLRLAQHLLKSSIGTDEEVAASATQLITHLDAMAEAETELREATVAIVLLKLLLDAYGHGRVPDWFAYLQRLAVAVANDPAFGSVTAQIDGFADDNLAGFIFLLHAARLPGLAALAQLFEELDALTPEQRGRWLQAMHGPDGAMQMIVDNAWLKESHRQPIDGRTQASIFEHLAEIALRWGDNQLAGCCYRTQALMLDEYAKDRDAAYASLDAAETRLPNNFDICRERGKISWRADDYARGYIELVALEDRMAETEPFNAAFALREAAICAGETDRWEEAARLFAKACEFARKGLDDEPRPLAIGLRADTAVALFRSGDRKNGVRAMAATLDELAELNPEKNIFARSVHLITRHHTLWMRMQVSFIEIDEEKTQYYNGAASNPNPKPALVSLPVAPLASGWMLLARLALDVGISSNEVLGWPGLAKARSDPTIDGLIRHDLLAHAIEAGSLDDFLRFLIPAIENLQYFGQLGGQTAAFDPLRASTGYIPTLAKDDLAIGSPALHIRTAAITFGLALQSRASRAEQRLAEAHARLQELIGRDVMPEWSPAHTLDQNDGSSIIAWHLSALDKGEVLSLDDLFIAHLRALEWAERSNHRDIALTALREVVRRIWDGVINDRKAVMMSPMQTRPGIKAALANEGPASAYIAAVLLAVEPAVVSDLSAEFRAKL